MVVFSIFLALAGLYSARILFISEFKMIYFGYLFEGVYSKIYYIGIGVLNIVIAIGVLELKRWSYISFALLTGYAATRLNPAGSIAMKKLLVSLATDKFTKGLSAKQFSEGINDVVLYIDGIDKETGDWYGPVSQFHPEIGIPFKNGVSNQSRAENS